MVTGSKSSFGPSHKFFTITHHLTGQFDLGRIHTNKTHSLFAVVCVPRKNANNELNTEELTEHELSVNVLFYVISSKHNFSKSDLGSDQSNPNFI